MKPLRLNDVARRELLWLARNARARKLRTMVEFAEQEIIIPDGKFEGQKFRYERQPFVRAGHAAIDSGKWTRFVATGGRQSSKTFGFFVIPAMYHLFELEETIVLLVPNAEMFADKWKENLEPAIRKSRFAHLVPATGAGSKGGDEISAIRFLNGATLKIMTGGGGDKKRAGFAARVLLVTETDDFDKRGGASVEADKLTQAMAVTDSFGEDARVYMECTVTVEAGRTWREYTAGTQTAIAVCCVHCQAWVTPGREHFMGWQEADDIITAREQSHFVCPACGAAWSEADRVAANTMHGGPKLIHRGQKIEGKADTAKIIGPEPRTDTFGLRWGPPHNMFQSSGDVGAKEWRAQRDPDPDNAERGMCQFVWAMPYKEEVGEDSPISIAGIQACMGATGQGIVPAGVRLLGSGCDLGKWLLHWANLGFSDAADALVIDYGAIPVASHELPEEQAVLIALREYRDICERGWSIDGTDDLLSPACCLIDAAGGEAMVSAAYAFVRENPRGRYHVSKGYGLGQTRASNAYRPPQKRSPNVRFIGDGYHLSLIRPPTSSSAGRPGPPMFLFEVNDDAWKSWVHARIRTPAEAAGGRFILFKAGAKDHIKFAQHLTAEQQVTQDDPRRGRIRRWIQMKSANHYFDAAKLACVAGHYCGVRLLRPSEAEASAMATQRGPVTSWWKSRTKRPGSGRGEP